MAGPDGWGGESSRISGASTSADWIDALEPASEVFDEIVLGAQVGVDRYPARDLGNLPDSLGVFPQTRKRSGQRGVELASPFAVRRTEYPVDRNTPGRDLLQGNQEVGAHLDSGLRCGRRAAAESLRCGARHLLQLRGRNAQGGSTQPRVCELLERPPLESSANVVAGG